MSASPAPSGGAGASASNWVEYTNAEGRTYWSHALTKQSVWDKPDELRTPFEKAMEGTPWKQYTSKGRVYYVNSKTKETLWNLPQELVDLQKKMDEDAKRAERGESADSTNAERRAIMASASGGSPSQALALRRSRSPSRSPSPTPEPEDELTMPPGGFPTHAAAEEAFIALLKKTKIDESLPWEKVMPKVVMHPLYKALQTLAEKKAAWAKYTTAIIENRRATKQARMDKLRPRLKKIFDAHPRIKSYSTFRTVDDLLKNQKPWSETTEEEEKRELFDEYIRALKSAEENAANALRQRNIAVLKALFKQLPITVSTTWREARELLLQSYEYRTDTSLQSIDDLDILICFEEHANRLIQEHDEEYRKAEKTRRRRARKARDGFRALLADLEARGEITAKSTWQSTLRLIEKDPAYIELCGMPGSSPLDLWMDVVDDMGEAVAVARDKFEVAARKAGKKVELGMDREAFAEWIKEFGMASSVDDKMQQLLYEDIQEDLQRGADDEKRRAERKRRHMMDDLRYAMKGVKPPIDLESTYEQNVEKISGLTEFKDLEDDSARREAFEKFIRRQKEKLEEREKEKSRGDSGDDMASATSRRHRSDKDRHRDDEHDDRRRRDDRDRRDRDRGKDYDRRRDDGHRDREDDRHRSDRRSSRKYEDDERDDKRRRGSNLEGEERLPKKPRTRDPDEEPEEGEI